MDTRKRPHGWNADKYRDSRKRSNRLPYKAPARAERAAYENSDSQNSAKSL